MEAPHTAQSHNYSRSTSYIYFIEIILYFVPINSEFEILHWSFSYSKYIPVLMLTTSNISSTHSTNKNISHSWTIISFETYCLIPTIFGHLLAPFQQSVFPIIQQLLTCEHEDEYVPKSNGSFLTAAHATSQAA